MCLLGFTLGKDVNSICPAMSFGDSFCVTRNCGTRGRWVVHPMGANSIATPGLSSKKALVGTGRPVSELFAINGL